MTSILENKFYIAIIHHFNNSKIMDTSESWRGTRAEERIRLWGNERCTKKVSSKCSSPAIFYVTQWLKTLPGSSISLVLLVYYSRSLCRPTAAGMEGLWEQDVCRTSGTTVECTGTAWNVGYRVCTWWHLYGRNVPVPLSERNILDLYSRCFFARNRILQVFLIVVLH